MQKVSIGLDPETSLVWTFGYQKTFRNLLHPDTWPHDVKTLEFEVF
jgi:hypothetical protein